MRGTLYRRSVETCRQAAYAVAVKCAIRGHSHAFFSNIAGAYPPGRVASFSLSSVAVTPASLLRWWERRDTGAAQEMPAPTSSPMVTRQVHQAAPVKALPPGNVGSIPPA